MLFLCLLRPVLLWEMSEVEVDGSPYRRKIGHPRISQCDVNVTPISPKSGHNGQEFWQLVLEPHTP